MLIELKNARKFDHGKRTKWFSDDYFDLTVWLDDSGEIVSFQLTYDKYSNPHALSWKSGRGYLHEIVDDGEISGRYKKSPILLSDGHFSKNKIADRFNSESAEINTVIADFIYDKILSFGETKNKAANAGKRVRPVIKPVQPPAKKDITLPATEEIIITDDTEAVKQEFQFTGEKIGIRIILFKLLSTFRKYIFVIPEKLQKIFLKNKIPAAQDKKYSKEEINETFKKARVMADKLKKRR